MIQEPFIRLLLLCIALLLIIPCIARSQATGSLSGIVLDKKGKPVIGATIRIVGRTQGAISRHDGTFMIRGVPPGTHTVRVSCVGYGAESTTVKVAAGEEMKLWRNVLVLGNDHVGPPRLRVLSGPIRGDRMGTIHKITFANEDVWGWGDRSWSARETVFGGGF
jgi:Carboxypeptidase regulatory-like domain